MTDTERAARVDELVEQFLVQLCAAMASIFGAKNDSVEISRIVRTVFQPGLRRATDELYLAGRNDMREVMLAHMGDLLDGLAAKFGR